MMQFESASKRIGTPIAHAVTHGWLRSNNGSLSSMRPGELTGPRRAGVPGGRFACKKFNLLSIGWEDAVKRSFAKKRPR